MSFWSSCVLGFSFVSGCLLLNWGLDKVGQAIVIAMKVYNAK